MHMHNSAWIACRQRLQIKQNQEINIGHKQG